MNFLVRTYRRWAERGARLAVGIALPLAFVIAMLPDAPGPEFSQGDKLVHALVFLLLTLLARIGWPTRMAWWGWPLILLGYGVAIELAQAMLPWREASLLDWLADLAGVLVAKAVIGWQDRTAGAVVSKS